MSDFVFLHPHWLWACLPLAILVIWLAMPNKQASLIAPHLASALGIANKKKQSGFIALLAISWLFAAIALAGPSFEKQARPTFSNNSARVLVMDMSRSQYATDLSPNRLTQQRYKALDLLKGWRDGVTGLVAFAKGGYTVSPMTSDTRTITNLVPELSPKIMPDQGANVVAGVKQAIKLMTDAKVPSGDIILMTDSIDKQQSQALQTLLSGTPWHLIVLGVGTASGAPIPLDNGSMLQDQGHTVIAKMNTTTMQALTSSLGGLYVPYRGDGKDIDTILSHTQSVSALTESQGGQTVTEHANNGYWIVLILLVPALLLFRRGVVFAAFLVITPWMMPPSAQASAFLTADQQAHQAFQHKQYQQAAQQFTNPEWQGVARYKAGDYQGAIDSLSKVKQPDNNTRYNLANAYAQAGDLNKAKALYQQVLKSDPHNQDAKKNLSVVKRAQQQQQQQQHNSKSDRNNKGNKQPSSSDSQKNQSKRSEPSSSPNSSAQHRHKGDAHNGRSHQPNSNAAKNAQSPSSSKAKKSAQQKPHAADQTKQSQHQASRPKDADSQNKSSDAASQPRSNEQTRNSNNDKASAAQAKSAHSMKNQTQQGDKSVTATQASTRHVDPALRKLDQVESARDPSELLRAQLYLQSKLQPQPDTQAKKW